MSRLRPLAPLLVAMLAGCQLHPAAPASDSQAPLRVATPGVGQAIDPDTGQVYYVVCDPCLKPTPKTRAVQVPPVVAAPPAPAVPVKADPPVPDPVPAAIGTVTPAPIPVPAPVPVPTVAPARAPQPNPTAQPVPASGSVVHCVPFAFGKATFGPVATKTLMALAPEARNAESIHIRAYTSRSPGGRHSPDANEALAAARAAAIRQHLIQAGIAASRISTSHCTDCFIESNDTVAGQRANRQALVVLRAKDDAQPLAVIDRNRLAACRLGGAEACK